MFLKNERITRISRPYGHLKFLVHAESLLASLIRMFALLTRKFTFFVFVIDPASLLWHA